MFLVRESEVPGVENTVGPLCGRPANLRSRSGVGVPDVSICGALSIVRIDRICQCIVEVGVDGPFVSLDEVSATIESQSRRTASTITME